MKLSTQDLFEARLDEDSILTAQGKTIITTGDLAYSLSGLATQYIPRGTRGFVTKVEKGPGAWSLVEVSFGIAPITYRCNIAVALTLFRLA